MSNAIIYVQGKISTDFIINVTRRFAIITHEKNLSEILKFVKVIKRKECFSVLKTKCRNVNRNL